MAVSIILAKKIMSLLLMLVMGVIVVRAKILKSEDSRILSAIALYLITPCMMISAYQVDYSDDVRNGLLIALVAAFIIQIMMIVVGYVVSRFIPMDPIEKTSMIYANAGNLIIPIVTSVFGSEYVIYTTAYTSIQLVLFWSHCKMTICGEKKVDLKKIFLNINMISLMIGLVMFAFQIKLPDLVEDSVSSVGSMIGPLSMIITGMLIGSMDLKQVFTYRRVWMVVGFRLLIFPVMAVVFLKYSPLAGMVPDGKTVLGLTLLASSAPAAATVTQMSQIYGADENYASACNIVTTLLCVVTMPIMLYLYQM